MKILAKTNEGCIAELSNQEIYNISGVSAISELQLPAHQTYSQGQVIDVCEAFTQLKMLRTDQLKSQIASIYTILGDLENVLTQIPDVCIEPTVPVRRKITMSEDTPAPVRSVVESVVDSIRAMRQQANEPNLE